MVAKTVPNGRGVPYPEHLPVTFRRLPASVQTDELVAWWWICEWDVPVGQHSNQQVLAFPALNFTVDDRGAGISGATSSASTRELTGRGWVIGALLKPAGTPVFTFDPASLRNRLEPLHLPGLHSRVADRAATGHLDSAVDVLSRWLVARAGALDDSALTANRMGRLATTDPQITSVSGLADAVGVSQSGLYRLARRYVGVSPYSMIRRRRLQEIAERIRLHPGESLADVAVHFGMTDQAHLGREFKSAFGITPGDYRSTCSAAQRHP